MGLGAICPTAAPPKVLYDVSSLARYHRCVSAHDMCRVAGQIIRHARTHSVGKYQSCMFFKMSDYLYTHPYVPSGWPGALTHMDGCCCRHYCCRCYVGQLLAPFRILLGLRGPMLRPVCPPSGALEKAGRRCAVLVDLATVRCSPIDLANLSCVAVRDCLSHATGSKI